MPKLSKPGLLRRFELAVRDSGARLIVLSSTNQHPATYTIVGVSGKVSTVLLYIWNLTHGGGSARPAHEYRIQITGTSQFRSVSGEATVILGWSEDFEVFAGFDYRRHSRVLGSSPSMQISQSALQAAQTNAFAAIAKGNGETAIAFRSDFSAAYVEHLTALHDTGMAPIETSILDRISGDPASLSDSDIEAAVAPIRRIAIVQTRRAVRDAQFRRRVLNAYGHRCAMCGVQLRLLDAAHILPVEHPQSTDETSNGVALCAQHHRAYDRALVSFIESHDIVVNKQQLKELNNHNLIGGIAGFQAALKPTIFLPPDRRDHPYKEYVMLANKVRGW